MNFIIYVALLLSFGYFSFTVSDWFFIPTALVFFLGFYLKTGFKERGNHKGASWSHEEHFNDVFLNLIVIIILLIFILSLLF